MIELRQITRDNFEEIVNLKVNDKQSAFVSTVAHSLAQAWLYKDTAFPFAIYNNNTPVGFIMLGYYEERNQYTLWKFLIDEKYQNNGYGKQALALAVDFLSANFNAKEVFVGVSVNNKTAKHLYMTFGFQPTGRTENGTEELKYICKN